MKYEVLRKYNPQPGGSYIRIPAGAPLEIRILPENTDIRKIFIAMVQSAYEMDGTSGLGGLASLHEPDFISEKEAAKFILYDSEISLTDRILRKPDTRIPKGVMVDDIRGRATKLIVYQSEKVSGAYKMDTHVFVQEVGSVDLLFELIQEKLR